MSMETFQNVDEWLISTDVGSELTSFWNVEDGAFVSGLDDDLSRSYLTSPCIADSSGCDNITYSVTSPVLSKHSLLLIIE